MKVDKVKVNRVLDYVKSKKKKKKDTLVSTESKTHDYMEDKTLVFCESSRKRLYVNKDDPKNNNNN